MSDLARDKQPHTLMALAGVVLGLTVLHVARDIFIPVAIAILLSFLLAPLVKLLVKWHLPNVVAVLGTVLSAFSILGLVGWLVSVQFVNFIDNLPDYQENLSTKLNTVFAPGDSALSRAGETLDELREEIENGAEALEPESPNPDPEPLRVVVEQPRPSPLQTLRTFAQPLLGPLGTGGLALIFVIFILMQRNDLRDRFTKLVSGGNLNLATEAVDDAGQRITRYLLMHTVINVTYGIPVAIALYFIGVPNALLWGILATLLRFIPFVGAWIAAFFPIALAFAVDPGWTMPLLTIAFFICLELFSNNVLEPWLYGSSTGISAVALIFAALVWTWIWGPVGLFLSTPLTVCLLVLGKNSPSLSFLHVILGTEPVLAPDAHLYQRMLAMDAEAMLEAAEQELEANPSLTNYYDQVLIPALTMAERDRHSGAMAELRQTFIQQSTRDLIEDLGERVAGAADASPAECRVLCLAANDPADELTSLMLLQVLEHEGIAAETLPLGASTAEIHARMLAIEAKVVCVCAIPPGVIVSSRRLIRRVIRTSPVPVKVLAGVWGTGEKAAFYEKRLGDPPPDFIATTFAEAVVQIRNVLASDFGPMVAAPLPPEEDLRLAELERLDLLHSPPQHLFDSITAKVADIFDVPIALVTIVDRDRQVWKSQVGLPADLAEAGAAPRAESFCGHVVGEGALLVCEDLAQDARFANNPFVRERGLRFYAGAPLRTTQGQVVGTLCVIDTKPRKISVGQRRLLTSLADHLMLSVER